MQGEPLLIHAAENFLGELSRQRPWVKASYEDTLNDLDDLLSAEQPATLGDYLAADRTELQARLPHAHNLADVLDDFDAYLREWRWVS
ncbi:hypothetical protein [Deinococcus radiophilus]|uniref:hypothetical protein n=1 Tax=Deinococcus radiophilus TaxID=32062 RepID=UPI0036213365